MSMDEVNAGLKAAVQARLDATPLDDPKMAGYRPSPLAGCKPAAECAAQVLGSLVAPPKPEGLRPGSREFIAVLEEIKQLHLRKTLDYGVNEDALSNVRESAAIVNMPAWAGCVLRIYDKMHRLKAYFRRGKVEFDGLSDTLKDIASYAVIAEVLRREEQDA